MCNVALSDSFRLVALLVAIIATSIAVIPVALHAGRRMALTAICVGAISFATIAGGSVLAVNHCTLASLEAFDRNGGGIYDASEQQAGFQEAEFAAIGDGGRNLFALASPVLGAALAILVIPLVRKFSRFVAPKKCAPSAEGRE